ncbi:MAG: carbon storage regulator [Clostridiales bacterium]|nr:carbon storage regulator [Clostridiales bacterium]
MLILKRKKGQGVQIGENIKISLVDIDGDNVKISIEAPREVKILRNELAEAAKVNQEAARQISKEALLSFLDGSKNK